MAQLLILALVLIAMLATAVFCAIRLARPVTTPSADVASMKLTLERRVREGADFRF